jgi:hypothetical protein
MRGPPGIPCRDAAFQQRDLCLIRHTDAPPEMR